MSDHPISFSGRGYPTPDAAIDAVRRALEKYGLTDIHRINARTWTDKPVFCPWEAIAILDDEEYERLVRATEVRNASSS